MDRVSRRIYRGGGSQSRWNIWATGMTGMIARASKGIIAVLSYGACHKIRLVEGVKSRERESARQEDFPKIDNGLRRFGWSSVVILNNSIKKESIGVE